MGHKKAEVSGLTPQVQGDVSNVWDFAKESQSYVEKKQSLRRNQIITLPNEPVGIAVFSDLHLGSGHADYESIQRDAELVAKTEGLYAIFNGDGTDNWIVGKLQALQRGQAVGKKLEDKLFVDWIRTVTPKLVAWCSGNHDEWTTKLTGWSPAEEILRGAPVLYDPYQISFILRHGSVDRTFLIRHKWRYSSIYNPTHPIEVGWDRGDIDFDIGMAGHTHIGTYCRPFHKHGKRRYAILTGTYKKYDQFGEELGFPSPKDSGCGMMVLLPGDRELLWFDKLSHGILFLEYVRLSFDAINNEPRRVKTDSRRNSGGSTSTRTSVRAAKQRNKGGTKRAKGANTNKFGKKASPVKRSARAVNVNGRRPVPRKAKRN